jgi:hypothetical protein
MSSQHRCSCGQHVEVRTPWTGFAYLATFFVPGTDNELRNCAGCGANLYTELKAGRLVEQVAR